MYFIDHYGISNLLKALFTDYTHNAFISPVNSSNRFHRDIDSRRSWRVQLQISLGVVLEGGGCQMPGCSTLLLSLLQPSLKPLCMASGFGL